MEIVLTLQQKPQDISTKQGFTIVELIIVITVIAVLAGIVIISYGSWRQKISRDTAKSDLLNASAAMESNLNFGKTYPSSVAAIFTPSDGTQLTGGAIGSNNFCISVTRDSDSFFMTKQKLTLPGVCPLVYFDPSRTETYPGTGTMAKDLSGNANDAIFRSGTTDNVAGPVYVASDGGGALEFDGTNSKYYVPNTMTLGQNMTWFACAKTLASANGFNMFMGQYLPYFGTYTNGTGVVFSNNIGGSQRTIYNTGAAIPLNTWNCYAFTTSYDGTNTTMKIYVNGAERSTGTYAGAQNASPASKFTVGDGQTNTWYPYKGRVADVGVYLRTMSATEVQSMFDAVRGKFGI